MSIKIKKKTLKIIGIVIVAILIIVGIFFLVQAISTNIKIKDTEEKLSQINAEELKTKLMEELEKTELNVDLTLDTMFVDTSFTEGKNELEDFIVMSVIAFKNNKTVGKIEIPCFKIESDSNGKFINIEYVKTEIMKSVSIYETIKNVFRNSYNIELRIENNAKYNKIFNTITVNKGTMETISDDFFLAFASRVNGAEFTDYSMVEDFKNYETAKFGLNIEKEEENKNANKKQNNDNSSIINLTEEQKNGAVLAILKDILNQKVNEGDLLDMSVKAKDNYDRYLVYSIVTSCQSTLNPDNTLKMALSSSEYNYMYYLTKNITKNRIYIAVISLNSKDGKYDISKENLSSLFNIDYETFINAQNGSDATSEKIFFNEAIEKALSTLETAKIKVGWDKPRETVINEERNNNNKTNSKSTEGMTANKTNTSATIKNGIYNKILTSEEKEDMLVELGDISIKIEDNKITLTDIDMQCTLKGTYTIENEKIIGKYTEAEYYSHQEMKDITQTIDDRLEFEIQENNKLYDTMGYGQFLGKCLYRNATYELVE